MGTQKHIIRKLVVEISVPTQEEALRLQNKLTDEYQTIILSIIEEILDRMVAEDEVIQLDKLVIDAGNINIQHAPLEISARLKKEMEEVLSKLLYEVRNSTHGKAEVFLSTSGGEQIIVSANRKTRTTSELESLIYFLQTGLLSGSQDHDRKKNLTEMIAIALEKYPEQLRAALLQIQDHRIAQRLAMQLPENQLFYVAAVLGCSFASKLQAHCKEMENVLEEMLVLLKNTSPLRSNPFPSGVRVFILSETLSFFSSGSLPTSVSSLSVETYTEHLLSTALNSIIGSTDVVQLKMLAKYIPELPSLKTKKVRTALQRSLENILKRISTSEEIDRRSDNSVEQKFPIEQSPVQKKTIAVPEKSIPPDEHIYIENAGLVILHPYLLTFFRNTGLVEERKFVSENARYKAIHLLQWLVYGDDHGQEFTEHDLVFNKLLCGMEFSDPIPMDVSLSEEEKTNAIGLLEAIITNWPVLKKTSVHGLRVTFLQKQGRLKQAATNWELFVQRDSAVEILIDRLPWSISMVKLPWNDSTIFAQW